MDLKHHHLQLPTGVTIHIAERDGSGTPVLMLHGIWDDWRYFQRLIEGDASPLADHPTILIDQRGHGSSSKPAEGYGLSEYASDVLALIEQRAMSNVILAGHSLGALVALRVASIIPETIEALLLEDPPLPPRREAAGMFSALLELKQLSIEAVIDDFQYLLAGRSPEQITASAERLKNTADGVLRAAADGGLAESVTPIEMVIDIPALAILPEDPEQRAIGDEGIAFLETLLPNIMIETIPDTSHTVLQDAPERYREIVGSWLDSK